MIEISYYDSEFPDKWTTTKNIDYPKKFKIMVQKSYIHFKRSLK